MAPTTWGAIPQTDLKNNIFRVFVLCIFSSYVYVYVLHSRHFYLTTISFLSNLMQKKIQTFQNSVASVPEIL